MYCISAFIYLIPLMSAGSIIGLRKHIDMETRTEACPSGNFTKNSRITRFLVFHIINFYVMEWLLPIFICIIFILTTKEFELIWYRGVGANETWKRDNVEKMTHFQTAFCLIFSNLPVQDDQTLSRPTRCAPRYKLPEDWFHVSFNFLVLWWWTLFKIQL